MEDSLLIAIYPASMTKAKAFGRALKKVRLKKNLTQEDLSLQAEIARVYIYLNSNMEKKCLPLRRYLNYPKL